jgi:aryl-alcohol dehydrogenase-like predicted oxidoreductase
VLRQPNVSSAITGASRPQQVDENVRGVDVTLPNDLLRHIDDALGSVVWYER